MVRMKKNLIFLIFLLNTIFLHGRGLEVSEEANTHRQITMCVYDDFISGKRILTSRFDDIPSLREWVGRDKSIVLFVNRLAIVLSAPDAGSISILLFTLVVFRLLKPKFGSV